MIYFPNKTERYLAGLRNSFQDRILKNGLRAKYLRNLKKIYESEALLFPEDPQPIAMEDFCAEILTAVFLKKLLLKQSFDFYLNLCGNYMVRQKLFTAMLLNLATQSDFVEVLMQKDQIIIRSKLSDIAKAAALAKKLGGSLLYERTTKKALFTAVFAKTQKKARDFEKAYALLENPLSVVNFYLWRG